MLKKLIFGTLAGFFGLGVLLSLWGVFYWRSQSMRQLPQAEIDKALLDYHAWLFLLVVSGVVCLVFSVLFALSFRRPGLKNDDLI
jgi:nicotinamide riboside transporter PnuC